MKMIHCADFHLDSQLHQNLSEEQANGRRNELLETFLRIVRYAVEQKVRIILIAGDLFDREDITQYTRSSVLRAITDHPDIVFFYVTGNHEKNGFIHSLPTVPKNLKLFHDHFTTYTLSGGGLTISGMNPGPESETFYEDIHLPEEAFNIVLLHGQDAMGRGPENIAIRELAHNHIDYLALGHIHSFRDGRIDARGTYVYPGCPEGRGYDEAGEKGFVLMDVNLSEHTCDYTFVPFAARTVHVLSVEVTGLNDVAQIIAAVKEELSRKGCRTKDYVKVILTGEQSKDQILDTRLIASQFTGFFYDFRVENATVIPVDYARFERDESVRGEFVRLVNEDANLSEAERDDILRYGLAALAGEEVHP